MRSVVLAIVSLATTLALPGLFALPARAEEPSAPEAVHAWLGALRDGKAQKLIELTEVPLAYRETWPNKQCQATVATRKALEQWLKCLHEKQKLLIRELEWQHENLKLEPGQGKNQKLREIARKLGRQGEWLHGWINGDGVTYEFLFQVDVASSKASGKPRLSACIIDAGYDSG